MNPQSFLGFPPPLLGEKSVRLQVLYDDGDCIALSKPPGLLVQQDSWFPRIPVLIEAIRYQASQGKAEFRNLGIGEAGLWSVYDLDPECFGPVLFARQRETAESLRSLVGSGSFTFHFEFITKAEMLQNSMLCELPLARHERLPRMLVSNTTGKKSATRFSILEPVGSYSRCAAESIFPRRHQILLHALESDLPVLGDQLYAHSPLPLLSRMKRDYRVREDREERPLYPGPAYFLRKVTAGEELTISGAVPPKWAALIKQLAKYSRA